MKTEIQVRRGNQIIFRANLPLDKGPSQMAGAFKMALAKFTQQHPDVSVLDADVSLKLAEVTNA
jgi:galactokinase